MAIRSPILALTATVAALLFLAVGRADAASYLGSPDTTEAPQGFACAAACPAGTVVGFRQFALRGATVDAPEDGVLVSASVQAKRLAGTEQPRIAVLRPTDDGVGVTVASSAPIPVSSREGALGEVEGLRLPVQQGDSVGFLFRAGEVDLGMRMRPRPDGAIQSFAPPCDPCGMDGGTGVELLYDAVVEPDVDSDGLGDETQDPDGGGLGEDWEDDWFEDFDEGDDLDEDFGPARRATRRRLRLLGVERRRDGGAKMLLRVPRAGRLNAAVTLPSDRFTGAGPFLTILTGDRRVRRPGRVWLRLASTPPGNRVLARRRRVRTKVVVSLLPREKPLKVLMRSAKL